MRLFVAMLPPVEVLAHLDEHIDGVRSARPDLRWSPFDRWHLTLEFLGECGPHEVDRQLERWDRRARRGRPMDLRLEGAGAFPHPFMARAVWAGIGGELDVWRRVAAFDQQPHLTLARTRERTDLTGLVDELARYRGPSWQATTVTLIESRLGRPGPHYQPVEHFSLGGQVTDG